MQRKMYNLQLWYPALYSTKHNLKFASHPAAQPVCTPPGAHTFGSDALAELLGGQEVPGRTWGLRDARADVKIGCGGMHQSVLKGLGCLGSP